MSDPGKIREIQAEVTVPVMAKARIGHFVEAQILEALEVDYIDESEVLTPADEANHIDKWEFTVPFVCGATDLGEALRRISEGAAMIRSKGEAGTGDVVEAVRHMRSIRRGIAELAALAPEELHARAKDLRAPYELVKATAELGRLPVVMFTAGGIATPADAAMMMQLGADGCFVGSGIFKSDDPAPRARAIVEAVTHFRDAKLLAKVSEGLGAPMVGIGLDKLEDDDRLAKRGW
jgi:pyridoxal 5'-phosphate synthase pdxS subunit